MNGYPKREQVERIRVKYPNGARVELIEMNDSYREMPAGLKGTVVAVDDTGTVHIAWDNGSSLGAVYGVDRIRRINDQQEDSATAGKTKLIVPCDVAIKRFYRMYVEVGEDATEDEVKAKAVEMLTDGRDPDKELTPDPDLDMEPQDICWVNPDFEGSWTEEEEAEMKQAFEEMNRKDDAHEQV